MPNIADKILAWPSRPPIELEPTLLSLRNYDDLKKAPRKILEKIATNIPENHVLALWMRNTFVAGYEATYSIEQRDAAIATHETHKQDYRSHNPTLMKVYAQEELKSLQHQ